MALIKILACLLLVTVAFAEEEDDGQYDPAKYETPFITQEVDEESRDSKEPAKGESLMESPQLQWQESLPMQALTSPVQPAESPVQPLQPAESAELPAESPVQPQQPAESPEMPAESPVQPQTSPVQRLTSPVPQAVQLFQAGVPALPSSFHAISSMAPLPYLSSQQQPLFPFIPPQVAPFVPQHVAPYILVR